MSISIREKDEEIYVGKLAIGTFFVHKEIVYIVTEYSLPSATTAVCVLNDGNSSSFGGEKLPSHTRVRTVKLVEAIFE